MTAYGPVCPRSIISSGSAAPKGLGAKAVHSGKPPWPGASYQRDALQHDEVNVFLPGGTRPHVAVNPGECVDDLRSYGECVADFHGPLARPEVWRLVLKDEPDLVPHRCGVAHIEIACVIV